MRFLIDNALSPLLANLPAIERDLLDGSLAVIEPERIRIRRLPLIP